MKKYTKTLLPVRRRGWTFIELLVTIVILAIATLFVAPQASSGASASGQSATRLAVTEILAAQMDAVALQEFRRINFFADGGDDALESQGHNQKSVIDFSQDTRFTNVSISSPLFDGANTSIIFDQTGGVIAPDGSPSTGGSFEVKSGDHAWQVLLAPLTGKVTVSKVGSP
jgi:prepilin-type N-terminal cleavage/methylation domain-containing protein